MSPTFLALLFVAALLYAAAGQGGGSGYIAVMGLHGVAPEVMRPTALSLNVVVTAFATWRLWRAGWGGWPALWPFLLGSIPAAAVGGAIVLPAETYRLIVGLVLIGAGSWLWWNPEPVDGRPMHLPAAGARAGTGGAIGLLSGLTGIGGGVFLAPVMLILRWADPRRTAGMTAPFILLNSIAALAGNWLSLASLPPELPAYVGVTLAGAILGTHLAVAVFSAAMLRRCMALVLLFGGAAVLLR